MHVCVCKYIHVCMYVCIPPLPPFLFPAWFLEKGRVYVFPEPGSCFTYKIPPPVQNTLPGRS